MARISLQAVNKYTLVQRATRSESNSTKVNWIERMEDDGWENKVEGVEKAEDSSEGPEERD